ncbi:hypothetical protein ACG04R_02305 [Roseateles sp. BYS78W]|uniref:Transporter n=1 Tax=Pelomonas candidula TaxID=3299025 RepID=A0ABW7H6M8_9BURK
MIPRITAACLLALGTTTAALAAPFELVVYSDDVAAPGEVEVETVASLAHTRAGSGLPRRVGQVLGEVNYGIANGWAVGLELPYTYTSGRHKVEGLAVELQYVAPHDEDAGWFWGVRADVGRTASVYEAEAEAHLDVNPIVGYRGGSYRVVLNPSLESPLKRGEGPVRFQPSAKVAVRASQQDEVGAEYYGDWGPLRHPLTGSRRDETLYAVWDRQASFGRLNLGVGQALRTSGGADRWVLKMGVQFELD